LLSSDLRQTADDQSNFGPETPHTLQSSIPNLHSSLAESSFPDLAKPMSTSALNDIPPSDIVNPRDKIIMTQADDSLPVTMTSSTPERKNSFHLLTDLSQLKRHLQQSQSDHLRLNDSSMGKYLM
jgi:hypothetical protein